MKHWKTRLALPIVLVVVLAASAGVWALGRDRDAATPVATVRVVKSYPHDRGAFTQGLAIEDGRLYESTGLYGKSSIREVDLKSGVPIRRVGLDESLFGEGMTILNGELFFVTWKKQIGYVLDPATFAVKRSFRYGGQGWGLTDDGTHLILSDGSATLRFLDPRDGKVLKRLSVRDDGRPVDQLNELEFTGEAILANIWHSDRIARIDPASGEVVGWIDASGLRGEVDLARPNEDVLNGIAYDPETKTLYLTGKRWPKLFEVEIVPAGGSAGPND